MELRQLVFSKILGQTVSYFDQLTTGYITSRLTSDTAEMANDLTFVFRWTIESTVRLVGITTYLYIRQWQLAAAACAVIPICALINRRYGQWLQTNATHVQAALAETNSVAQETIAAVRTVKAFAREAAETGRYSSRVQDLFNLNMRQVRQTERVLS